MNKQSIDSMLEELSDLKTSLILKEIVEKTAKRHFKQTIKELSLAKKFMNQSIRERKYIQLLIKKMKSKIAATPARMRRWSKDNPERVRKVYWVNNYWRIK